MCTLKKNKKEKRSDSRLPQADRGGGMDKGGQKTETSSDKINKYEGYTSQRDDQSQHPCQLTLRYGMFENY